MTTGASSTVPLSMKFKYHVNIILNDEGDEADSSLALSFCDLLLSKFEKPGCSVFYPPRDTLAGSNYFDALFEALDESYYTVVILTPGFAKDGWSTYSHQVALKTRLDEEPGRYIPIGIGVTPKEVPKEVARLLKVVYFDQDFSGPKSSRSWEKLQQTLFPGQQVGANSLHQTWRVLTDAELTQLTSELGFEWQMLVIGLGVTYARIQQIQDSYTNNTAMQIFASLWHWREYSQGDEKSKLHTLVAVLQKNNKTELAERLDGLSRLIDDGPSAMEST